MGDNAAALAKQGGMYPSKKPTEKADKLAGQPSRKGAAYNQWQHVIDGNQVQTVQKKAGDVNFEELFKDSLPADVFEL